MSALSEFTAMILNKIKRQNYECMNCGCKITVANSKPLGILGHVYCLTCYEEELQDYQKSI